MRQFISRCKIADVNHGLPASMLNHLQPLVPRDTHGSAAICKTELTAARNELLILVQNRPHEHQGIHLRNSQIV